MKALRTATLLLIMPTLVFCQEKKLTIGINGAPSFYTIKSDNLGVNHQYTSKPGYHVGIDLSFHFSKRSEITTGLYYSNAGYKVDYNYIFQQTADPAIPRSGDITMGYLEIPVIYNFSFITKEKFVLYSGAGIVSSFLKSSNDRTTFQDNSIRSSGYLNSFLPSLQLGLGLEYDLNKNWGIKIEPQYRFYLKGFDIWMNQRPTAFNGTIGIVYNFRTKVLTTPNRVDGSASRH
jgi:opacity protein-like surface antigen